MNVTDDRLHLSECGICHAPEGEPCADPGIVHIGRRWKIGITAQGSRFGTGDDPVSGDGGRCRPTTEDNHRWDHTQRNEDADHSARTMIWRGACLGCGWHGPTRDNENLAVEDAHDHAWPGWRTLPIVPRCPYECNATGRQKWINTVAAFYRLHGFDVDEWGIGTGAPIRTERRQMGTRSHYSHDVNGYDICGHISDDTPRAATPVTPSQISLF